MAGDAGLSKETLDGVLKHAPVSVDCNEGWCRVPAGCFVMGSPESEPAHAPVQEKLATVTLTHSFLMQRTEMTRADWMHPGLPDPGGKMPDGTGDCTDSPACPVGNVTWFEAAAYANRLSERHVPPLPRCYDLEECTGELGKGFACKNARASAPTMYECKGYRLPTDAEWEYSARAGTRTAFYSGEMHAVDDLAACAEEPALAAIAWYCGNSGGHTHPVGTRQPNGFGLFDMSGNVSEWVNGMDTGRPPETARDPGSQLQPNAGAIIPGRVIRGGNYRSWPALCRLAWHHVGSWDNRAPGIGFRLVRSLD